MLEQREIVLIPVPFTDLTSQKRRPVLIISNDRYHRLLFEKVKRKLQELLKARL